MKAMTSLRGGTFVLLFISHWAAAADKAPGSSKPRETKLRESPSYRNVEWTVNEQSLANAVKKFSGTKNENEYFAEKLEEALRTHIGHKFSAGSWSELVQKTLTTVLEPLPLVTELRRKDLRTKASALLVWALVKIEKT